MGSPVSLCKLISTSRHPWPYRWTLGPGTAFCLFLTALHPSSCTQYGVIVCSQGVHRCGTGNSCTCRSNAEAMQQYGNIACLCMNSLRKKCHTLRDGICRPIDCATLTATHAVVCVYYSQLAEYTSLGSPRIGALACLPNG
jgi:hypothetical protein